MAFLRNGFADALVLSTLSMGIGLHPRAGGMSRSLHRRESSVERALWAWDPELSNSISSDRGVVHRLQVIVFGVPVPSSCATGWSLIVEFRP